MTTVNVTDAYKTVVVTNGDGETTVVSAPSPAVTVETTALGPQGPGGVLGMYGTFIDTTTQPLASTAAAQAVNINTTLESRGVTITSGNRITFAIAGTYKIFSTLQITNSSNSISEVNFFFKKNGVDQADTNTRIDLQQRKSISTPFHGFYATEHQITVVANDYLQICWVADQADVALQTIPANGTHPEAASVTINVAQVMYTQTASVPRSITVANPVANDNFTLFRAEVNTVINRVLALVRGTTPSVTFVLKAGPNRNAAGTAVTVSEAITNTTTGEEVAIINQPIPAGYYVWLEITAVSGLPSEFNVSIEI